MSQLKIYPLSEKPEYVDICAAWSFAQWGCHVKGATLGRSINRYKERTQNTKTLPLTWTGVLGENIIGKSLDKFLTQKDQVIKII